MFHVKKTVCVQDTVYRKINTNKRKLEVNVKRGHDDDAGLQRQRKVYLTLLSDFSEFCHVKENVKLKVCNVRFFYMTQFV